MEYQKISDLEKTLAKIRENNGDLPLRMHVISGKRKLLCKVYNVTISALSEKKFIVYIEGIDLFPDAPIDGYLPPK